MARNIVSSFPDVGKLKIFKISPPLISLYYYIPIPFFRFSLYDLISYICISDEEIIALKSIWSNTDTFCMTSFFPLTDAFRVNRLLAFKAIFDACHQSYTRDSRESVNSTVSLFASFSMRPFSTPQQLEMIRYVFSKLEPSPLVHTFRSLKWQGAKIDPRIVKSCAEQMREANVHETHV